MSKRGFLADGFNWAVVLISLSSMPRACIASSRPFLPNMRTNSSTETRASSPILVTPISRRRSAVLGQLPIAMHRQGGKEIGFFSGGTTVIALGGLPLRAVALPTSVAVLASNLFVAILMSRASLILHE